MTSNQLYVDGDAREQATVDNVEMHPIDVMEFLCLMKSNIQCLPPVLSQDIKTVTVTAANVNTRVGRRDFIRAHILNDDVFGSPIHTVLALRSADPTTIGLFSFAVVLVVACHILKRPVFVLLADHEMMVGPTFRLRAAYRRLLTTMFSSRSRISINDFLDDMHNLATILQS